MAENETPKEGAAAPAPAKKTKKISKVVEGFILTITAGDKVMRFDAAQLDQKTKDHALMHGLSQKLGDSAAGAETAAEAAEFISKVWEALKKGEWTTKAPAGEKLTKKSILDKFNGLSEKERQLAEPLLKKLGFIQ